MIVDCHTHIFPEEIRKNRQPYCQRDPGFSSLYKNPNSKIVGVEELIASMDESGIERSVICGFSWSDPTLCGLHNQYLMESMARYPDRLIPFISLPFSNPEWSGRELERRWKEGAKGVGEIAFYAQPLTSRLIEMMNPVLQKMEKEGIPLMLHTNEPIGHSYPGKGKTPLETFYKLILSFPKLTILLAHWGGGFPFYELMPEVSKATTHVYYDTAASPYLYSKRIYGVVKEIVGVEKILFGSDFPLIMPKRYFRDLEGSGLSALDRTKILGKNFLRLIGS
ncbi:MAG: amidohydrolase family protein [Thermodesulfobacteriota bacterium]